MITHKKPTKNLQVVKAAKFDMKTDTIEKLVEKIKAESIIKRRPRVSPKNPAKYPEATTPKLLRNLRIVLKEIVQLFTEKSSTGKQSLITC